MPLKALTLKLNLDARRQPLSVNGKKLGQYVDPVVIMDGVML